MEHAQATHHGHDTFIPALDHLTLTNDKAEGLVFVLRTPKLLRQITILAETSAVNANRASSSGSWSTSFLQNDFFESHFFFDSRITNQNVLFLESTIEIDD